MICNGSVPFSDSSGQGCFPTGVVGSATGAYLEFIRSGYETYDSTFLNQIPAEMIAESSYIGFYVEDEIDGLTP